MLKVQFLNTWGGSLWGESLKDHFMTSALAGTQVFCLQEVHLCMMDKDKEFFVDPVNRGHRTHPILTNQYNLLSKLLEKYRPYYAENASYSLHDLEKTQLGISFGNAIFIRNDLSVIGDRSAMAYGQFNMLNDGNGTYCGRKIQGVIVWYNNQPYLIFNIHGIWTGNGKGDCKERTKQTANINRFMWEMFEQCCRETGVVPSIILGGDFNLTSDTRAFNGLMQGKVFGDGGALNLNNEFGIHNTRTYWYPEDKPSREADYVLVSRNTKVHSFIAPAEPAVSDHRPLILECK